jgi:1,4-dihydroxy-2-naphthoate octaprenyltransferase
MSSLGLGYKRFTLKAAVELASPPSLVAAVMPVLVGGVAAPALARLGPFFFEAREPVFYSDAWQYSSLELGAQASVSRLGDAFDFIFDARVLVVWLLMLVTAVLMQAAVNTLNDYQDFLSGTDTAETILDTHDASIVYNQINPRAALRFGIVLLVCAAISGIGVVLLSSWVLLLVGIGAAAVLVLYSAGPKPISFLPLGELVSGLVMGVGITCATYYALTLHFTPLILLVAVPPFVTVALIMLTNNTCDIERDVEVGRRTLPVLIGRASAVRLATACAWVVPAFMLVVNLLLWHRGSVTTLLFGLFIMLVLLYGLYGVHHILPQIAKGPYSRENRSAMMGNATEYCWAINSFWIIFIKLSFQ